MSCFVMSFQTQLASVMEILVKAAISEVTKIVEGSLVCLQAEVDERKKENESLKLKLLVQETEWRTERAYGAIGCTHIASRRSVGVQVHDGEVMTGGGMLAAEEEGFLGEDWNCSLWKPMTRRHSNVAKPESHSGFTLERAEVERIVIKEESAELEEQAVGQGCVSQQQQESHRFARKRPVESQAAVDRGVAGRGSETQCCEGGWGSNQRGGGGGVCEGPGGLYEPDTNLEQEEDHTLEAELDFMMAPAVGGAWQHKPACAVEQLHLITPPAKDKVPPGSKVAWNTPASPYAEEGEGEGEGEGGQQQHWQNQQQCGGSFHSPCLTYPSEPSTPARFPSAECQEQETPAATANFLPPPPGQNSVTNDDGLNRCGLCGKTFSTPWTLKTHQRIHTGERPYSCTVCGRSFQNLDNLKTHRLVHTGERPFGCPLCGKRFSLLRNLKTHQRTHTGEKPYSCSECGRTFGHLQSLETHQRIHTGEKPYSCTHCGKNFSIAQNLKTHLRIHTGEKPYCCTQCGKCFSQLGNLRTHQRTHTGERPYCCNQCGKSFSLLQNLKTHQRIHSSNRV